MVNPLLTLSFWITLLYFIFCCFLAFYIPGRTLIKKYNFTNFQNLVIGITVGIALWTWQGFIFGLLNVRWMTYPYLLVFLFFWLKTVPWKRRIGLSFKKTDYISLILIFIGVIVQSSIIWFTGIKTAHGIIFCCGDVSADIYHIGLTHSLLQRIPPFEPEMANTLVSNYHYFSNLAAAELIRIFKLPILDTEFRLLAPLISLFLGLASLCLSDILSLPRKFARWLIFFFYFSGDFLYIVQMVFSRRINFSFGPLENGASFLENPPRAFALVVFLAGLFLLINWFKKKDLIGTVLIALLFSSTVGFKVYIGIFALTGLFSLAVYSFKKRLPGFIVLFFITLILSAIVYLPVNSNAGGLYFTGFWRFEEFGIQPQSGLNNFVLALQVLWKHNNKLHIIVNEAILFFCFVVGEFGPKLVALIQNKKSLKAFPTLLHIFLIPSLIVSFITGLFFQQNAGGSNSFNFLVSVYTISSFYAALALSYIFQGYKKPIIIAVTAIFIISNVPRIAFTVFINNKNLKNPYLVENSALDAMKFIDKNTPKDSVILSDYAPYLVFVANRQIFINSFGILESHGVDTKARRIAVDKVFKSNDSNLINQTLLKHKIDYIYVETPRSFPQETLKILTPVYSNMDLKIYKVLK